MFAMNRPQLGLVAVAAGLLLMASAGTSATYYVAPVGSDANTGLTPDLSWQTIGHAMGEIVPGDTVMLGDGTYREMVRFDEVAPGGLPVVLQAINPRKAIIDSERSTYCIGADWDTPRNLVLEGLLVRNGLMGIGFQPGAIGLTIRNCEISGCMEAIRVGSGSGLVISDCVIRGNDNGILLGRKDESGVAGVTIERTVCGDFTEAGRTGNRDGVAIEGLCTNVAIRDCVAFGAGDSGFDLKPDGTVVERCKSYGNGQWGIKLWGSGCRIVNTILYGNQLGGMGCAGNNLTFWNCTFGAGGAEGLRLETSDSASCIIRNTIFHNAPVVCKAGGVPDENYNCYYAAGAVITSSKGSYTTADVTAHTAPLGANSIARDPLFVNAAAGEFGLLPGGPCIGRGIYDPLVSVDYHGRARGDPPDMGAISTTGVIMDPDAPISAW